MIHIEKYFNNQDRKALYKLLANKKQGKKGAKKSILEDLIERKSVHSFRQDLYANQCVQDKLLEFFHGKCAYCEDFRGNQRKEDGKPDWDWQTEHFRPKAGVSEEGKTHHGYYWLGYECTNFLIGCYTCNKQYKGTQFPIMSGTTRLKVDHFIENGRLETNSCSIFHDLFKRSIAAQTALDLKKKAEKTTLETAQQQAFESLEKARQAVKRLEIVAQSQDFAAAVSCQLLNRLGDFWRKSREKYPDLPKKLFLSVDNGYNKPQILECSTQNELILLCVPKKSELFEKDGTKQSLQKWIDSEYLEREMSDSDTSKDNGQVS